MIPRTSQRRRRRSVAAAAGLAATLAVSCAAGTPAGGAQLVRPPVGVATRFRTIEFEVVTLDAAGRLEARRGTRSRAFVDDLGGGVTLEMVEVPGGAFAMGSGEADLADVVAAYERMGRSPARSRKRASAETPKHSVAVGGFYVARFEITQAQWRAVATMPRVRRDLERAPATFAGDERPVESISWYDAEEFCARLSRATGRAYRLPSEAEWEYACRAGTATPFHFGPTISAAFANYWGDATFAGGSPGSCREDTVPVGSLGVANAFGLADMHGNVAEWCLDTWHASYDGAPADARAWEAGSHKHHRVVRGGSWYDLPVNSRSASRRKLDADDTDDDVGLRVVVTAFR